MKKKIIIPSSAVLILTIALAGFGAFGLTLTASGQAASPGEQKSFTGTISGEGQDSG